jgi:histidine triad (HIT) family protein
MELPEEQINEFKQQIVQQIESTFSEDKKGPAIERINSMNNDEFIDFLKKNKLLSEADSSQSSTEEPQRANSNESPFRLIVEGKIPSYALDENKKAIAVLEIRPVSKGHSIIIPKEAISDSKKIPKSIFSLAKKIEKKIKEKLNPKEVLISHSFTLGENIINIVPVYSNESLDSPRKQASKEELEELKSILEKKQKIKKIKQAKIKKLDESKIWLPRRIP